MTMYLSYFSISSDSAVAHVTHCTLLTACCGTLIPSADQPTRRKQTGFNNERFVGRRGGSNFCKFSAVFSFSNDPHTPTDATKLDNTKHVWWQKNYQNYCRRIKTTVWYPAQPTRRLRLTPTKPSSFVASAGVWRAVNVTGLVLCLIHFSHNRPRLSVIVFLYITIYPFQARRKIGGGGASKQIQQINLMKQDEICIHWDDWLQNHLG